MGETSSVVNAGVGMVWLLLSLGLSVVLGVLWQRSGRQHALLGERVAQLQEQLVRSQHAADAAQQGQAQAQQALATAQAELAAMQAVAAERTAQFAEQRRMMKAEFEQLSTQIFERKSQHFLTSSQQSLDLLLKPFREQIEHFRVKVEDIHHKDVQQQASLQQELVQLQALNRAITEEAHQLSTALRGQKKMQGNWGELILENVLDRSGLILGRDYQREVSLVGEQGRQRPDVVVNLPQRKHLIIDAKVSLEAYTCYLNAEDDTTRQVALQAHVQAMRDRIRELSDRNYFNLPGLNSPDMVFLFVPIESAFVEAMKADESLFQTAIEQHILVATPTTLLTSLNIVRQLWRFEDQNRHTAELADRAQKVYDKLRTFLGSMDDMGRSLERAQDSYRKACDQLVNGRGNLVKQVADFQRLGVSVRTELPEAWQDRADLELDQTGSLELTSPDASR